MHRYILKRFLMLIPVILGVSFIVFFLMDLAPGTILDVIGTEMDAASKEAIIEELGLNRSVFYRYFLFMKGLVVGDLGFSYTYNAPVMELYLQRVPYTIQLALASMLVCVVLSLPLGIWAALKHGTLADNFCSVLAILGLSIPNFWLGLLLIVLFAQILGWLPSYGAKEGLKSLILPAFTVGTGMMATMTRTTRSSMLDVLRSDYLRTARAKGVDERIVVNKHGLRNALIPIITVFGTQLGGCFAGAVVTENVFSYPGVGQLMVAGINRRDTTLVCGFITMSVIMISVVQLLVDILYAYVDPRLRSQYASGKSRKKSVTGGAKV